ncbi:MAG: Ca2+/H+ antiporter, family [Euryarchaeota archaeon]|jgi:putative Ca2+/H+ antiporter (TMEM165/GDT1 family)|nr:Ca2+/H+ antiporter, family [Euryarchaeota archaeon]
MSMPLNEIIIPLIAVGLAEMGDKTQLSVILLSSRTREYIPLLAGVMLAFLITDGFAILIGSWMTGIIPLDLLKLISGGVFILFGALILRGDQKEAEEERGLSSGNALLSGFSLIFLSEWGDKTQIASALFATEYNPFMVFIGVMAALFILSVMAIYLGQIISQKVDRKLVSRIAGTIFLIIGTAIILSLLAPYTFAIVFK